MGEKHAKKDSLTDEECLRALPAYGQAEPVKKIAIWINADRIEQARETISENVVRTHLSDMAQRGLIEKFTMTSPHTFSLKGEKIVQPTDPPVLPANDTQPSPTDAGNPPAEGATPPSPESNQGEKEKLPESLVPKPPLDEDKKPATNGNSPKQELIDAIWKEQKDGFPRREQKEKPELWAMNIPALNSWLESVQKRKKELAEERDRNLQQKIAEEIQRQLPVLLNEEVKKQFVPLQELIGRAAANLTASRDELEKARKTIDELLGIKKELEGDVRILQIQLEQAQGPLPKPPEQKEPSVNVDLSPPAESSPAEVKEKSQNTNMPLWLIVAMIVVGIGAGLSLL